MKKKVNLKISNSILNNEYASNEINIMRRTLENNTHEVFEDKRLKRITSWRKSNVKFKRSLIFNLLSFGILHIVSLFYPNLYIKLYCIPWPAKECDYFLVENIYGKLTLCKRIFKKNKNYISNDYGIIKENDSQLNNINSEYNNIIKNVTYSFEYKSCIYEYEEKNNEIRPIYMNLSKMTNKNIFNYFSEGLYSQRLVDLYRERYGKNEYKLDLKLIYLFFLKSQIPSLAIVIIIGCIEGISYDDYVIMLIKIFVAIGIIVIELIITKISFINKYKNEFTLDGQKKKVKVKRNYLLKNTNELYYNLNIDELLPGDLIILRNNEYVPCDCIIINGECLVSESNLTGSLNLYKKIALKNDSEYFNYEYSNINILYHGMKIIKTYSKSDNGLISALCINIGPNTFKANQYSNTLYFLERKSEYTKVYNLFGERKNIFVYIVSSASISVLAAVLYFSVFLTSEYRESDFFKQYFPIITIALICKSLMAVFFIIQNILILFSLINLNKLEIECFDKSRLIKSGKINKIFFNKTETLSETSIEINGYHPVSYNINKPDHMIFRNYLKNRSKDLNKYVFDYYQNYLRNSKNSKDENNYQFNQSEFLQVLFLECLLCCNTIEKYEMDFFGNTLEIDLFEDMKWDIKQNEENNNNNYVKVKFNKHSNTLWENKNINTSKFNCRFYYISKKISDIFPKNYFKLKVSSDGSHNNNSVHHKEIKKDRYFKRLSIVKTVSSSSTLYLNQIQLDIANSNNFSYKLRIYKKFIVNGSFDSASIVYNFLTKELRFMIKGTPEEIINKCASNTLPHDLEKVISINRKNGFILLACATKKLQIEEYDDSDELEHYMEDLTFIGFLSLENRIKDHVQSSIQELKKYNEDFKIISGDNVYNCLSTGFQSGLIENQNVFILDKEENNKITLKKIYSCKTNTNGEKHIGDDTSKINRNNSRLTTNVSQSQNPENCEDGSRNISNKSLKKSLSLLNKQKNDISNNINNDIFISELDNIPELENNINLEKNKKKEKTGARNNAQNELLNTNSEFERILNKEKSNRSINTKSLIKTDSNNEIFFPGNRKIKKENSKNNRNFKEKKDDIIIKVGNNSKNIIFMEKYYFHDIFKDSEEIDDSIFCMSGKFLNYLCDIKSHKGLKKFMDKIMPKSKIFFEMTSLEKSLLVDYYRECPNNIVCVIGQCESDIDSILSSDIGINLKNPKNMNTILSHYFSKKNDIICIKDIIINGKVFFENNFLLESISFVCTLVLNGYILCCISRNVYINKGEINFLEIEFFILTTLSYLGKPKENIYLKQNSRLYSCYYYLQFFENIFFRFLTVYIFCLFYKGDDTIDWHSLDLEFLSYFFVLMSELLICGILSFNFISFFRESVFSNFYLIIAIEIYLIYLVLLTFLTSSNFSNDILNITHFLKLEKIIDCFTDKNRLYLFVSILFDFFGTLIFNWVTYQIFNLIINYYSKRTKINK